MEIITDRQRLKSLSTIVFSLSFHNPIYVQVRTIFDFRRLMYRLPVFTHGNIFSVPQH